MISQEKIQEIIDKTDIVEVVSEYVELKKRGKNYMGLCPFHDDHDPSFSVSPDKKIALCMTCKEGGNPINFLRKIKNITFDQAAKELATRYNVTLDEVDSPKEDYVKVRYYQINKDAMRFYEDYLFNSKSGIEALDYLHKRGLSDEVIKFFHIGLAPKEKDKLYQFLVSSGYNDIDILDIGLINKDEKGAHDIFNNRITFPIIDQRNNTLAFSARVYYETEEARYINTGDTPIYQKGLALYNLNNAVKSARKKNYLILCEGQMDVIAMVKAGFGNTICSLGTALTSEQVKLIKTITTNVIILYDGDKAGRAATKKAFDLFEGFQVYSAFLPAGMDPDEYLKEHSKEELANLISNQRVNKYDFLFEQAFYGRDASNAYQVSEIKADIFDFLKKEKSRSTIENFLKKLADKLNVSYEAIFNDFNIAQTKKEVKKEETPTKSEELKSYELTYFALSILNKEYFDYFNRQLGDNIDLYCSSNVDLFFNLYNDINYGYKTLGFTESRQMLLFLMNNHEGDMVYQKLVEYFNQTLPTFLDYEESRIDGMMVDLVKRFKQVAVSNQMKNFKENIKVGKDVKENLNNLLETKREEEGNKNGRKRL